MRKNQLEAIALTGMIEGKRDRGRQRKNVHGLDINRVWRSMEQQRNSEMCRECNEHLLIANVKVGNGTYIGLEVRLNYRSSPENFDTFCPALQGHWNRHGSIGCI